MKNLEQYILAQFKKKMKMEDTKLQITLDVGEYGEFENGAIIMESVNNGRVWQVTTTRTGNIKSISEV